MYKWTSSTLTGEELDEYVRELTELASNYPSESIASYTAIYNSLKGTDLVYVEESEEEEEAQVQENKYEEYLQKFGRDMTGVENAPLILIGYLLSGEKDADNSYLYLLGLSYISSNYDAGVIADYSEFVRNNFDQILKDSVKTIAGMEVKSFCV